MLAPLRARRRPALTEVDRDIHQDRCWCDGAVFQRVGIDDRLDRATRLPVAAQHVIFRLEHGAVCRTVIVCGAGVGEDVACARIKRCDGGIVDFEAVDGLQPVCGYDADALQIGLVLLDLRGANGEDPLLSSLLHPPIERRDDLVSATVKLLLATLGVGAEDPHEEVMHPIHKVRRTHFDQRGGDQDDLFSPRSLNLRVGDGGGFLWDTACSGRL